jgi:hypothetical protein
LAEYQHAENIRRGAAALGCRSWNLSIKARPSAGLMCPPPASVKVEAPPNQGKEQSDENA